MGSPEPGLDHTTPERTAAPGSWRVWGQLDPEVADVRQAVVLIKALSKRRSDAPEGMKGTPFSQCVAGGAKLLRQQKAQNDE